MGSDRIRLSGLAFYSYHGLAEEERRLGQRFVVDLDLRLDLTAAATSDDLGDTIDYSRVYREVETIVTGPPSRLLEALAGRIATHLLAVWPRLEGVLVTVQKPGAPIQGAATGLVSVTVARERVRQPEVGLGGGSARRGPTG